MKQSDQKICRKMIGYCDDITDMVQNYGDTAVLSSFDHYTTFSYGGRTLTFRTCDGLERYTKVLTWDDGYLEVMARYRQRQEEIEEYIDLDPVLTGLYMDRSFIKPIKKVRIEYA